MPKMNICSRNIFCAILILTLFFYCSQGIAQCAGTNIEVTLCDKETDQNLLLSSFYNNHNY